ncbi:hypothetical protein [Bacteroides bouchesdurhonensis]|uniref:hypothetical protein n=1 Tax=Bacteroides bouchesdurhonensis TaxID=1841855 RepID=UPI00097F6CDF|nr:hypothetical protein [Bacteroides bouchesdurhonensis]
MRKIFFLLLTSLLIIQASCLFQSNLDERDKQNYLEIISLYPESLVSHFPENVDSKRVVLFELLFPRGRYLNYIHLGILCDNEELNQLRKEATFKAKGIYHITDSCLVLPYDYAKFEILVSSDSIRNSQFAGMLPIPSFHKWETNFPSDFNKEAIVYLLAAEKGSFLTDDCLSRNGVGLPDDWKHGYTKGVSIYKNYAIYWLEVW